MQFHENEFHFHDSPRNNVKEVFDNHVDDIFFDDLESILVNETSLPNVGPHDPATPTRLVTVLAPTAGPTASPLLSLGPPTIYSQLLATGPDASAVATGAASNPTIVDPDEGESPRILELPLQVTRCLFWVVVVALNNLRFYLQIMSSTQYEK